MPRGASRQGQIGAAAQGLVSEYSRNTHGGESVVVLKAKVAAQSTSNLPLIHGVKMQARGAAIEQLLA